MRLQAPLRTVTSALDGDVLAVLAGAEDWFTVSRLQSVINWRSIEGIRKTLARLANEGVVDVEAAGTATLYRLNREHLATPAIIQLTNLQTAFLEHLRTEMESWLTPPQYAAIFGSSARGQMTTDSDIDLFLLRPSAVDAAWDERVDDLAARVRRWTGNELRVLEFAVDEARGTVTTEPVLRDIIDEGITVFGDSISFRRLVGSR